jgi:3',5'-cyclic AMP phosphodiesterase CpdA
MPTTADAAGNPILVGAGDIARCDANGDEQTAALLSTLPGIVFTLGDNVYDSGSAKELQDCYGPSWGKLLDRTGFVVAGNHDWETDHAKPSFDYFGSRMVRNGVTWFSQDVGTWHLIVLDGDCSLVGGCGQGSPQMTWLQADLAASQRACTIALFHQPLFSSGTRGGDAEVLPFWQALAAAGAELVLNGHEHDYERFAPQAPDGTPDPARGITEIVVGTGGGDPRGFRRTVANSLVRADHLYGVISVTLLPHGWTTTFTSTDGSFSDSSSGTCH